MGKGREGEDGERGEVRCDMQCDEKRGDGI